MRALAFTLSVLFSVSSFAAEPHDYNWVFVGGFMNEQMPTYMNENVQALLNSGVSLSQIKVVMPPSNSTVIEGAELVRDAVLEISKNSSLKVIVISHSRGGDSSFHAMVRFADQLSNVEKAFLVESVVGGSRLADSFIKNASVWKDNPLFAIWSENRRGVESMTFAASSHELNESESLLKSDLIQSVSDRIFYVRAAEAESQLPIPLQVYEPVLKEGGANDGMVPVTDQKIDRFAGLAHFGHDLGIIEGRNHLSFFVPGAHPTDDRIEIIRDFTISLLGYITQNSNYKGSIDFTNLPHKPLACEDMF